MLDKYAKIVTCYVFNLFFMLNALACALCLSHWTTENENTHKNGMIIYQKPVLYISFGIQTVY